MKDITDGFSDADLKVIGNKIGVGPHEIAAGESRREEIHKALKSISDLCDGCLTPDRKGFSRLSVRVGHWLSARPSLTPLQAAIARHIVFRHRLQVPLHLLGVCAAGGAAA